MKVYFIENSQVIGKQLTQRQISALKNKNIKLFIYTPCEWWYAMLYSFGSVWRFYMTHWQTITAAMSSYRKRISSLTSISADWLSYQWAWTHLLSFAREKYASQDDLSADIQG